MSVRPSLPYFFLSYARSTPVSSDLDEDHGSGSVERFFRDLGAAVSAKIGTLRDSVGFFDRDIPATDDLKSTLSRKLGSTQVFVPLCSPNYLTRAWAVRERRVFESRVRNAGADPGPRLVPLLWSPFLEDAPPADLQQALDAGPPVPDYHEYGLRMLCLQPGLEDSYRQVVDWCADEIVALAERSPLEPSQAPALDEIQGVPEDDDVFLLAFVSAEQAGLTARTSAVTERLGLAGRAVPLGEGDFAMSPGLVLLRPGPVTGLPLAELAALPEWASPVVVGEVGAPDAQRVATELADELGARRRAPALVTAVPDETELQARLPGMIAGAWRRYNNLAPVYPPEGESPRPPRLSRRGRPDTQDGKQGGNADD